MTDVPPAIDAASVNTALCDEIGENFASFGENDIISVEYMGETVTLKLAKLNPP